jgi:hypothetical protein
MFPNGAFFDYYSEIETIFSKIVRFLVALWTAHLALRMAFPKIYKFIHEEIYHHFDIIPLDKKVQYAVSFMLVFILAAAIVFSK